MFDLPLTELEAYHPAVEQPADFEDFWRETLDQARTHPLDLRLTPVDNKLSVIDTVDVAFAGYGGTEVRAWLHVPAGARGPLPTVVQYQGYSRGRGFPHSYTGFAQAGWAHLVLDTRAQGWSDGGPPGSEDRAEQTGGSQYPGLMTAGILDPRRYYYRRVYTDAIRLLDVVGALPQADPRRVVVTGASQGGGITIAAAGLATLAGIDLLGAAPDVPFLCHFRRAVELTERAPYTEITSYLAGWRDHSDAVFRTLSYMDGVNLGRYASCPALFSVGLMDPVCPPSTVYAAFNHYGGEAAIEKEIVAYPHNEHEGGEGYQFDRQLDWFAARFAAAGPSS